MHVAVQRNVNQFTLALEAIGPTMASINKSLAEMNKSGNGDRATKERSALRCEGEWLFSALSPHAER
jgi:hypothetical protein